MSLGFHPIADLFKQEVIAQNTRIFLGEGSLFLKVPGLKRLDSVRQDTTDLSEIRKDRYPLDPNMTRFEEVDLPLAQLTHLPDGTPILLRNIVSNDGMWQSAHPFYVTGEWDESVPAPEIAPVEPQKVKKGMR